MEESSLTASWRARLARLYAPAKCTSSCLQPGQGQHRKFARMHSPKGLVWPQAAGQRGARCKALLRHQHASTVEGDPAKQDTWLQDSPTRTQLGSCRPRQERRVAGAHAARPAPQPPPFPALPASGCIPQPHPVVCARAQPMEAVGCGRHSWAQERVRKNIRKACVCKSGVGWGWG